MLEYCETIAIVAISIIAGITTVNELLFLRKKKKHQQECIKNRKTELKEEWRRRKENTRKCPNCKAILSESCTVCWNCGKTLAEKEGKR